MKKLRILIEHLTPFFSKLRKFSISLRTKLRILIAHTTPSFTKLRKFSILLRTKWKIILLNTQLQVLRNGKILLISREKDIQPYIAIFTITINNFNSSFLKIEKILNFVDDKLRIVIDFFSD